MSKKTWPNPRNGTPRDNVSIILNEQNFESDCKYGVSKVFIKCPQTIFGLESKRTELIPVIVLFLQKHLRGALARRYYKRLKAANKIANYYKKYKSRVYITNLTKVYGQAKSKSDFGKRLKWPVSSKSFAKTDNYLKNLYTRWVFLSFF